MQVGNRIGRRSESLIVFVLFMDAKWSVRCLQQGDLMFQNSHLDMISLQASLALGGPSWFLAGVIQIRLPIGRQRVKRT